MKARIKSTGTVLDVVDILLRSENNRADVFSIEDVEIINDTPTAELCSAEPDWEQRRFEASIAAMQGLLANRLNENVTGWDLKDYVSESVEAANLLISELKKQKP
jgi:hypothetical protein